MSIFIVIEGMDGSGKSTITKLLAKKLDFLVYKTPPLDLNSVRDIFDRCGSRKAQFFYYTACNFYTSSKIEKILDAGLSVVCDRYYYTTISAYYDVFESSEFDLSKSSQFFIDGLLKPNFSFFLDISEEERKNRLMSRLNLSSDDLESMKSEIYNKNMEIYGMMNLIKIDTNNLSPDQVSDQIIEYISGF